MVIPEDLYDCKRALFASLPELQVSLRLHDYFMGRYPSALSCQQSSRSITHIPSFATRNSEMVLDLLPAKLYLGDYTGGVLPEGPESKEEIIMIDGKHHHNSFSGFSVSLIDSLSSLTGLQLVGDRLFGPQPRTAVYLCLWEATIGRVNVQATPSMLAALQRVGKTFGSNMSDAFNSPPDSVELAADPDSTCRSDLYPVSSIETHSRLSLCSFISHVLQA